MTAKQKDIVFASTCTLALLLCGTGIIAGMYLDDGRLLVSGLTVGAVMLILPFIWLDVV